jgi:hypothetical protein
MNRLITLLLMIGLGTSLFPPATCFGLGPAACCCAGAAGDEPDPAGSRAPRFGEPCGCGCTELTRAADEAAPRLPATARPEPPAPSAGPSPPLSDFRPALLGGTEVPPVPPPVLAGPLSTRNLALRI